ncbi:MAG: CoA pyrophosphatase [Rhodospirillaceae bacterium]|nr:CoA pyrophosphatase [Rhodospirillaceae bacterium]
MRAHIEARLAAAPAHTDPLTRTLRDVEGPVPQSLIDYLQKGRSPAAVLLGLVERPGGLAVLFTERAKHLKDHPGQVSFPGGRIQPGDAGPVQAALREAEEEIGLDPRQVAVAGCLERLLTVTGFLITPVVGFIAPEFRPVADRTEVADVFEVPLQFLLDADNVRRRYRERLGARMRVHEIEYEGHRIWGATASMLVGFLSLIYE